MVGAGAATTVAEVVAEVAAGVVAAAAVVAAVEGEKGVPNKEEEVAAAVEGEKGVPNKEEEVAAAVEGAASFSARAHGGASSGPTSRLVKGSSTAPLASLTEMFALA